MSSGTGVRYEISRRIGGGSFGEIFLGLSPTDEKVFIWILHIFVLLHDTNIINYFLYRLLLNSKSKVVKYHNYDMNIKYIEN